MAESDWLTGRLKEVVHPVGVNALTGEPRYRRATFDLLRWKAPGSSNVETYVVTPIATTVADSDAVKTGFMGNGDHTPGREFGFYELGQKVWPSYEVGAAPDGTFEELHGFGWY